MIKNMFVYKFSLIYVVKLIRTCNQMSRFTLGMTELLRY